MLKIHLECRTSIAFIAILLLAAWCVGGCAALSASVDVDHALALAARENVTNFQAAAADKADVYDKDLANLERDLDGRIVTCADGIAALALLRDYRVKKAEFLAKKKIDLAMYAVGMDNAVYMLQLVEQRLALRARWDALFGRIPAVAQLRAIAESEARGYMNAIATPK